MAKCYYCGEERDVLETIMNPNMDDDPPNWNVCSVCKEVIKWQQVLSFSAIMPENDVTRKMVKEAQDNLDRIARESKMPIMSATLYRKPDGSYDSLSVEYTGKGD